MKLLIDAQLPRRLALELNAAGHDAVHAHNLPAGNRTTDTDLTTLATRETRIIVTKDADFVASFWLRRLPPRLLLISTGNISNNELWRLLAPRLAHLEATFVRYDFVEINRRTITIHA